MGFLWVAFVGLPWVERGLRGGGKWGLMGLDKGSNLVWPGGGAVSLVRAGPVFPGQGERRGPAEGGLGICPPSLPQGRGCCLRCCRIPPPQKTQAGLGAKEGEGTFEHVRHAPPPWTP